MEQSPRKLLRFLESVAAGRVEVPKIVKTMARGVPRKYLEQIAKEDPRVLDAAIVATAETALAAYSDDALPIALVKYDANGNYSEVKTFGNLDVFPVATTADTAQLS